MQATRIWQARGRSSFISIRTDGLIIGAVKRESLPTSITLTTRFGPRERIDFFASIYRKSFPATRKIYGASLRRTALKATWRGEDRLGTRTSTERSYPRRQVVR